MNTQSREYLQKQFKKICLEGSGKGRIELAGPKYTFGYESQMNRQQNLFDLALDFPIIGETRVTLSLDPKEVARTIGKTQLLELLREKVGDRSDRDQIVKAVEVFFVFASDFINYRSMMVYPLHYQANSDNDHFVLSRQTPHYEFVVDNFSDNETYFERIVFKIFLKNSANTGPIMTLFLVPGSCDH
ncbi:MAG: hypothetical protein KBD76_09740 [Bacteriovorax sp.]|jgi:hypothetical protein|nr:hypothetical protein [Bacteriovorax sp.]